MPEIWISLLVVNSVLILHVSLLVSCISVFILVVNSDLILLLFSTLLKTLIKYSIDSSWINDRSLALEKQ